MAWKRGVGSLLALLLAVSRRCGGETDARSASGITRIAFGSCSKQWLPQPLWQVIGELHPELWIWTGDAAYVAEGEDVAAQHRALEDARQNSNYTTFLESGVHVNGIWDDHDLGANDGGAETFDIARQHAFLRFLGAPPEDSRWTRPGLYTSILHGAGPQSVKIILLDTRSFRRRPGPIYFPLNGQPWPIMNMIGRLVTGLAASFLPGEESDVLGEEQWQWLIDELNGSEASVHILVSSIQVLTPNPLFESWGHWPRAKKRLLELLSDTAPAGLVVVSGDVHFAEVRGWEVTSSGLTHSCAVGACAQLPALGHSVCSAFIGLFHGSWGADGLAYPGVNFGTLDVDWARGKIEVAVRDGKGAIVLRTIRAIGTPEGSRESPALEPAAVLVGVALCAVAAASLALRGTS